MRDRALGLNIDALETRGLNTAGVYCVKAKDAGYWKVGVTRNIRKRLIGLDEVAPFPLVGVFFTSWRPRFPDEPPGIPGVLEGPAFLEEWILNSIHEWHSHREWHFVDEEQKGVFCSVLFNASTGWSMPMLFGPAWREVIDARAELYRKTYADESPQSTGGRGC
jgi:hypothetical protein